MDTKTRPNIYIYIYWGPAPTGSRESLRMTASARERKRERERMTQGDQALMKPGLQLYFQKELLYPKLHISRSERYRVMQSQLNITSV